MSESHEMVQAKTTELALVQQRLIQLVTSFTRCDMDGVLTVVSVCTGAVQ